MRLLEFNRDDGGANPGRTNSRARKRRPTTGVTQTTPSKSLPPAIPSAQSPKIRSEAYPIQGTALRKLVRRPPIDLEQLQQRIGFLEKRLQDPSNKAQAPVTARDLDKLRQRVNRLESSLDQEMEAARAREERMLNALDRPPLKALVKARAILFWRHDLPRIGAWLLRAGHAWWQENQPEWWPRFANAWKESLEKARR
jgi:septal ring factor EnvC (AmiA/AmiB activator)